MARFGDTIKGIIGLSLTHLACGVCAVPDGLRYFFAAITSTTDSYHPKYLPWAEDKKRTCRTLLENAYKNDRNKISLMGSFEVLIGKATSYGLAFAGVFTLTAFTAPLGGIIGIASGAICLGTSFYHVRAAARSIISSVKSIIKPNHKADEAVARGQKHIASIMDDQPSAIPPTREGTHTSRLKRSRSRSTSPLRH